MANPNFRYLDDPVTVHSISIGNDDFLDVIGEPENCVYEWVYRNASGVIAHSNDGYCGAPFALRDGLNSPLVGL